MKAYESCTIFCEFEEGYTFNEITIKVGNNILAKNIDYVISGNNIVVQDNVINNADVKISVTAKLQDTPSYEEIYIKENSYLCENFYIQSDVNAISHNVEFALKNKLSSGQKLYATVAEDATAEEKVLEEKRTDLTNFTFDQLFYVPVKLVNYISRQSLVTKFSVKIECENADKSIAWTNNYNTLYIKFNVLNAWAGIDYRGYTNQYTTMDMDHFVVHLGNATNEQMGAFPFPIQLREQVKTDQYETIDCAVYNSSVHQRTGEVIDGVEIALQDSTKYASGYSNYIRGDWDSEHNWYNYDWKAVDNYIQLDATDTQYKTSYDVFLCLQDSTTHAPANIDWGGGILQPKFNHCYALFDLVVWKTNASGKVLFVQTFSGCKMTFIPQMD